MRDSGIGTGMYVQSTPAGVAFTNACTLPGAMQVLIGAMDDSSARVSLPFDFPYFGAVVPVGSQVNVCSNGWIALDGGTDSSLSGSVPSSSTPNAVIAPHWGDNYVPMGSAVCAATTGSPGSRRFVVSWPTTHYCCGAGANLSYEVVLHEGTGIIDFVYEVMEMARAQTMGIENQTGEIGIDACGGAGTCTPTSGQRIRFTPVP